MSKWATMASWVVDAEQAGQTVYRRAMPPDEEAAYRTELNAERVRRGLAPKDYAALDAVPQE